MGVHETKKTLLFGWLLLICLVGVSMFYIPLSTNNTIRLNNSYVTSYDGGGWLDGWDYRRKVSINGSTGAGTDYQVFVNTTYYSDMLNNFGDVRFTDNDGSTELDYWLEDYTPSVFAFFWVEVTDSLESSGSIYMYYGNSTVTSTGDGFDTFTTFYSNQTSIQGWTTADLTVSNVGDFHRFYNPTASAVGSAQRFDVVTTQKFQMMARYKTVSLGAVDNINLYVCDGSTSHRLGWHQSPITTNQTNWYYYDSGSVWIGAWVEGTESIVTQSVDETDSVTGVDYHRYDTSRNLVSSSLNQAFSYGSPTDGDGLFIGDSTSGGYIDAYFRWIAFRKWIDPEPFVTSFGFEEDGPNEPEWQDVGSVDLIFPIGWHPTFQFGYDAVFIFAGLIMIPLSTMYCVRGGRKGASMNKLFYALIIFMVGLGLLVGGIMP